MSTKKEYQEGQVILTEIANEMLAIVQKIRDTAVPISLPTKNLSKAEKQELGSLHRTISDANEANEFYESITEALNAFLTSKLENIEAKRQSKDLLRLQRYFYLLQKTN